MGDVLEWGMRVPFAKPVIGRDEIEAVTKVLTQSRLTEGPKVAEFEEAFREFCGAGMAIAVSSCTAALHLCWMNLIKPGDEVIVPALTHAATAMAVEAAGGVVRLADVGEDGNLSPQTLERALTEETKGISVVHFLGRPAKMQALKDVTRLPIVEDCALAFGARIAGRHVGLFGKAGCFSFYPAKHITTGEGGMVLTTNRKLADAVRQSRAFGKVLIRGNAFEIEHFGINYRMSEIAAAIGVVQMTRTDTIFRARRANSTTLLAALGDRAIGGDYGVSYLAKSEESAAKLRQKLRSKSIEASHYYPKPVHKLAYFQRRYGNQTFPMAEDISARSVTLPVGLHVSHAKLQTMLETISEIE